MSTKPKPRKVGQCQCVDRTCPCGGRCSVQRVQRVKAIDGAWMACAGCRRHRGIAAPKRKPRKARRVVGLAGPEPWAQLYRAVLRYVKSIGGTAIVIGGIEIQEWPGEEVGKYRVAIRCTGYKPTLALPDPPKAKR